MAEPFLAELRLMSFIFPPKGWALCNGQLLPINQNQGLFSLLGTTFGGDGRVNFGLPNLQGRIPIHVGNGHTLGESGGRQSETLSISQLPQHSHTVNATSAPATLAGPAPAPPTAASNLLAVSSDTYRPGAPGAPGVTGATDLVALPAASVSNIGGSQAHLNLQPYLTLSWCIALQGIFPSQT